MSERSELRPRRGGANGGADGVRSAAEGTPEAGGNLEGFPPSGKAAELEHFRLKSLDLGALTGLSIASHAIPDAFLLLHSGVGCKHKATTQLATHDLGRSVVDREAWTEVGDASLIAGSADRIAPYVRVWHERVRPAVMFVASVTFLDLTGDDFADEVRKCDAELPARIVLIKVPGYQGDLHTGYAAAVIEVVRGMNWKVTPDREEVALIGYLWDRYEADHSANLAHIGALLEGLGLRLGPVLLSGEPLAKLCEAPRARIVATLPTMAGKAKTLARLTGRPTLTVDLPMGIRGTSAFLRTVAAGQPGVEAFIEAQEAQVRGALAPYLSRFAGQRVAIFADLPLLVGLVGLAEELSLQVELVGIRGHSLGGREALMAGLARVGARLDCPVLENPSLVAVREGCRGLLQEGRLDGVLGSATDLNAIRSIPAEELGTPFRLEVGFPCLEHHAVFPMPTMGYAGVLGWAQRLMAPGRIG